MKHPAPKLHAFLASIREFPHIGRAAKAAGIARSTHYRRYDTDPVYAKEFDAAWRWGVGVLRDEAIRRALLGYEEPVIYKGQFQYTKGKNGKPDRIITVTKYPERLTMAVLRGELSDVYNRQRVELTAPGGGPVRTEQSIRIEFVKAPEDPDAAPDPDGSHPLPTRADS